MSSANIKFAIFRKQQVGKLVDTYAPFKNYTNRLDSLTVKEQFKWDLNHPIDIITQDSYDKSVNLIINDGENTPKLVNSKFSVTGKQQYEVVDRSGDNDTNVYEANTFQTDISLFKIYKTFPQVELQDPIEGGNLKVGNYTFYFKYSDVDGNETNIFAQSGRCACYIGDRTFGLDNEDYKGQRIEIELGYSVDGGYADKNSKKQVKITLTNLDTSFDYINVYYSRDSSDQYQMNKISCFKILDQYQFLSETREILITGNENVEEISVDVLNRKLEILDSACTQEIINNRLFLGNIRQHTIDYEDLKDLSLRIYPKFTEASITRDNMIKTAGYYPEEFYRFGIVYLYNNNTKSPVFNIRGVLNKPPETIEPVILNNDQNVRNYIDIDPNNFIIKGGTPTLDNACGVSRVPSKYIYDVSISIPSDVRERLAKHNITGYYIVRQKRIPTILTQMFLTTTQKYLGVPLLNGSVANIKRNRKLDDPEKMNYAEYHRSNDHDAGFAGNIKNYYNVEGADVYDKYCEGISKNYMCGYCPDFTVRQPYFNQLFNSSDFIIKQRVSATELRIDQDKSRCYLLNTNKINNPRSYTVKLQTVKEDTPAIRLEDMIFKTRCGKAEDIQSFSHNYKNKVALACAWGQGDQRDDVYSPILVRGIYSPFVALYSDDTNITALANSIVDVYVPGFKDYELKTSNTALQNILQTRYNDTSPYFQIGQRRNLSEDQEHVYEGDTYACQFWQRVNRNFQDPSAPNNDQMVKEACYADSVTVSGQKFNEDSWKKMNLGDINATRLGKWLQIPVYSINNLNIRSVDDTHAGEMALTGNTRAFYPYRNIDLSGNNKIPESQFINEGFSQSLGQLHDFAYKSTPYQKNIFTNRIYYSKINITDSYQNNFRSFQENAYVDYTSEHGQIIKLVEYRGQLIIVFEHAVGYVDIGPEDDEVNDVKIKKCLPLAPTFITTSYGSQFINSVIKTSAGIYGVDVVAKQIWRFSSSGFEVISNQIIDSFLAKNIDIIGTTPTLGISDCKAIYNDQKQDVMFTFYNAKSNLVDETSWNICYNEITNSWQTFYSWIPIHGDNLNKHFLTFDREVVRNYINNLNSNSYVTLTITDQNKIHFNFKATETSGNFMNLEIIYFNKGLRHVNKFLYTDNNSDLDVSVDDLTKCQFVFKIKTSLNTLYDRCNTSKPHESISFLYNHNPKQYFEYQDEILPTYWYNKQHPFEFEFIVAQDLSMHKIFNNMTIVSNSAPPESFHYEIVGDCFDFSQQKKQMYFRQEITRAFYHFNGSDISYDTKIEKDINMQNNMLMWDITRDSSLIDPNTKKFNIRSTMLPCTYYSRVDQLNTIEDNYIKMTCDGWNYKNLAGAEIVQDNQEYHIANHAQAVDITKDGRLRGNMHYREDRWFVQINPINIVQQNENSNYWAKHNNKYYPSIVVGNNPYPNDQIKYTITDKDIPEFLRNNYQYSINNIDQSNWGIYYRHSNSRKEIKMKDKYIKIKIRYKGDRQVFIPTVYTNYTDVV